MEVKEMLREGDRRIAKGFSFGLLASRLTLRVCRTNLSPSIGWMGGGAHQRCLGIEEEVKNYLKSLERASAAQPQPPIVEEQESLFMPMTQQNLQQSFKNKSPLQLCKEPTTYRMRRLHLWTKEVSHPLEVGTTWSQTDRPISVQVPHYKVYRNSHINSKISQ